MSFSIFIGKAAWFLFNPLHLLVIALICAAILLRRGDARAHMYGKRIVMASVFAVVIALFSPIGTWLITPLENSVTPEIPQRVDGIIILSGDEKGEISDARNMPSVGPFSSSRYLVAAVLARAKLHAKIIFVGTTPSDNNSGASEPSVIARETFTALGISAERWVTENHSRNTHENALFATTLLQAERDKNWVLVTSAWHMPRAILSFRAAGLNVYPLPSGWRSSGKFTALPKDNAIGNLTDIALALREYAGLIGYRIMGYTNSLWP